MSELEKHQVVVVGCGNMGAAIARGAVGRGVIAKHQLIVVDRDVTKSASLATELGCGGGDSVQGSSDPTIFVIATKPDQVAIALSLLPTKSADVVVSVAAGVNVKELERVVDSRVVRAMPNTPATIGRGITALYSSAGVPDFIVEFFTACGEVVTVDKEVQFDAITALSGSGPAYIFVAIEALADGGVAEGLPRDLAFQLAVETVLGAASLVKETGEHPAALKDAVASPGGTTIAGLSALENSGFRSSLIEAVGAAAARSRALSSE